jgi:hypothetical protein
MGWRDKEKNVKKLSGSNDRATRDVQAAGKEAKRIFDKKISGANDRRKKT